ncbi:class I SAM-dependent methyltransferase [Patescibacteria group bacterium]
MKSNELRSTYDRIAKDYQADHLSDTWDDDFIQYFIEALFKGAYVLDLGCGPGTDTKKLIQGELKVAGLDLSDELLKIAKKENPTVDFIQGNLFSLPYEDQVFDGVFAKASLLHFPKKDMPNALREISRVTKDKGIVHIAVKQGQGEKVVTEKDYGYTYSRFFSYWGLDDFQKVLIENGFTVLKAVDKKYFKIRWLKLLAKKVQK